MTVAHEIVGTRTTSELVTEVRAADAPVACCSLPSCPRPAATGARLCIEHGGAQEPAPRVRPMGERELAAWLSGVAATARYWRDHYQAQARPHAGSRVFDDISTRSERWARIARRAQVLFAETELDPHDFRVTAIAERAFLERVRVESVRAVGAVGGPTRDDRASEDIVCAAMGSIRREVRALLGVVA